MTKKRWSAVDSYIGEHYISADPHLDAATDSSDEAGLPQIAVSPSQGKLLMLIAKAMRARNILEIGTLGGYSTIWLARALPPAGRLVTLEYDRKHAEVARKNIARAGLGGSVEVRLGKASDSLSQLIKDGKGPFDLVFIDANKDGYPDYFRLCLKLTRPGSLIVADNVIWDGEVADARSRDPMVQGLRRFHEAVAAEPRVSATAIQTVGAKGYDGLAFVLVIA